MPPDILIFVIIILIFSIILHEIAHGYVAEMFGDPTARLAGRLTLNPVPHIDPFGSVILPAILALTGSGMVLGWAKPVPYNPYNLRNQKWGTIAVGIAGVLTNLVIAVIFGMILRFYTELGITSQAFLSMVVYIVQINIVLAVFNLIPFPPLDGAKVLFTLLPYRFQYIHDYLEKNWFIFIIFIIYLAPKVISPAVTLLFSIIAGV